MESLLVKSELRPNPKENIDDGLRIDGDVNGLMVKLKSFDLELDFRTGLVG